MAPVITVRTSQWVVDQQLQSPLFQRLPSKIPLRIFKFALEEEYDMPVRHNFRLRHGHEDEPHDNGVLSSPCESESARFTDSEDEMDTDDEDGGVELDEQAVGGRAGGQ